MICCSSSRTSSSLLKMNCVIGWVCVAVAFLQSFGVLRHQSTFRYCVLSFLLTLLAVFTIYLALSYRPIIWGLFTHLSPVQSNQCRHQTKIVTKRKQGLHFQKHNYKGSSPNTHNGTRKNRVRQKSHYARTMGLYQSELNSKN